MEIENNILNNSQEDRDESPHLSYTDIQANSMSTGGRADTSPTAGVIQSINEVQTLSISQPQDNNPLDLEQNANQQISFRVNLPYCYNSKPLELDYEVTLYWVTQENSIENSVQNNLPLYTESSWSMLAISSLS